MAGPPAVEIESVSRRYGEVAALARIDLSIRPGEFFSLLGPSGCGKTTLLRVIAGLDEPDTGVVRIAGAEMGGCPPHRRPVNTVFQSYALFPHLDVWNNIAFGLRMKGVAKSLLAARVEQVMTTMQIEALARRRPAELSGGQKQRVALARAIVNEPQVLLLDEPLGALDLKLRGELQRELHRLQRRLGLTFIYVTHDQDEALVLSDRIAIMREGQIEQLGTPTELYKAPRTRFVSGFLGTASWIEATIDPEGRGQSPLGPLVLPASLCGRARVTLAIRPEQVLLAPLSGSPRPNAFRARIDRRIYAGAVTRYELSREGQSLRAEVSHGASDSRVFDQGEDVLACLPPEALIVLED